MRVSPYQLDGRGRQLKDAQGKPLWRRTKKGDIKWQFVLEILAGPYQGRRLWDNLSFSERARDRLRNILVALGLIKRDEEELDLDPKQLDGKLCWVTVVHEEFEGRVSARIAFNGYAPMSVEEAQGFTIPPKLIRIGDARSR